MKKRAACFFSYILIAVYSLNAQGFKLSLENSITRKQTSNSVRALTMKDHRQMMELLHISTICPIANESMLKASNTAYEGESKANPFSDIPDALVLNNGLLLNDFLLSSNSLTEGDVAFRQHTGGHTPMPNWPFFLQFADRYIHVK